MCMDMCIYSRVRRQDLLFNVACTLLHTPIHDTSMGTLTHGTMHTSIHMSIYVDVATEPGARCSRTRSTRPIGNVGMRPDMCMDGCIGTALGHVPRIVEETLAEAFILSFWHVPQTRAVDMPSAMADEELTGRGRSRRRRCGRTWGRCSTTCSMRPTATSSSAPSSPAVPGRHNYIGHAFMGHSYIGHDYIDHNYIGHTFIGHSYIGHNYIGHNHIGHTFIGHSYIGHSYIGHNYIGHNYITIQGTLRARCSARGYTLPSARPRPTSSHNYIGHNCISHNYFAECSSKADECVPRGVGVRARVRACVRACVRVSARVHAQTEYRLFGARESASPSVRRSPTSARCARCARMARGTCACARSRLCARARVHVCGRRGSDAWVAAIFVAECLGQGRRAPTPSGCTCMLRRLGGGSRGGPVAVARSDTKPPWGTAK